MNLSIMLAGLLVLGSLIIVLVPFGRGPVSSDRRLGGLVTLNIGMALLMGSYMRGGWVSYSVQAAFLAGALWFLVLDVRLHRRRKLESP